MLWNDKLIVSSWILTTVLNRKSGQQYFYLNTHFNPFFFYLKMDSSTWYTLTNTHITSNNSKTDSKILNQTETKKLVVIVIVQERDTCGDQSLHTVRSHRAKIRSNHGPQVMTNQKHQIDPQRVKKSDQVAHYVEPGVLTYWCASIGVSIATMIGSYATASGGAE